MRGVAIGALFFAEASVERASPNPQLLCCLRDAAFVLYETEQNDITPYVGERAEVPISANHAYLRLPVHASAPSAMVRVSRNFAHA